MPALRKPAEQVVEEVLAASRRPYSPGSPAAIVTALRRAGYLAAPSSHTFARAELEPGRCGCDEADACTMDPRCFAYTSCQIAEE